MADGITNKPWYEGALPLLSFAVVLILQIVYFTQHDTTQSNDIKTITDRMSERKESRDKELANLNSKIDLAVSAMNNRQDAFDTRLRPVENSITSLANSFAFVRDTLGQGLQDISKRLDRIENNNRVNNSNRDNSVNEDTN